MDALTRARETRKAILFYAAGAEDDKALAMPSLFPLWKGEGVRYEAGDRVRYKDTLYRCQSGHLSQEGWAPGTAASLWVRIDAPDEAWPQWRQPSQAAEAYPKEAQVSHMGRHWVSTAENNVWEPGISGWMEVK